MTPDTYLDTAMEVINRHPATRDAFLRNMLHWWFILDDDDTECVVDQDKAIGGADTVERITDLIRRQLGVSPSELGATLLNYFPPWHQGDESDDLHLTVRRYPEQPEEVTAFLVRMLTFSLFGPPFAKYAMTALSEHALALCNEVEAKKIELYEARSPDPERALDLFMAQKHGIGYDWRTPYGCAQEFLGDKRDFEAANKPPEDTDASA